MQDLGISSGTPPIVRRPEGTFRIDITFEGTHDAKARDRHTRVRITCRAPWRRSCGTSSASNSRAGERGRRKNGVRRD